MISPLSVDGFVLLVVLVLASTPRVALEVRPAFFLFENHRVWPARENRGHLSKTSFWCLEKFLDELMKVGR